MKCPWTSYVCSVKINELKYMVCIVYVFYVIVFTWGWRKNSVAIVITKKPKFLVTAILIRKGTLGKPKWVTDLRSIFAAVSRTG